MTPAPRPPSDARGPAARSVRPADGDVSIGGLAAATGVAVETLRAWERRYGRPAPTRRASGHRRYGPAEVAWVRLASAAVAAGARPSRVARLSSDDLRAYLRADPAPPSGWLALVRRFDAPALERAVERAAAAAPDAATFLDRTLAPFLALLGARWAEGRLAIRHEHFATEVVAASLARLAARARVPARAPTLLLATLPGERHVLGLSAAAWVAAQARVRARSLGPDTPEAEVVAAAAETGAAAVGLAVSAAHAGPRTWRRLRGLRAALPPTVPLLVGGAGVAGPRRMPAGVVRCASFAALAAALRGRAGPAGAPRR